MKFRRCKRLLSLALAAVLTLALAAVSAQAASRFPDIYDDETAQAVEVLYALGVVNGADDGQFHPDDHLTRVQFCKMAIEIMGKGDLADAQMYRTIFTDVGGTHWGRGYVNLAATMELTEGSGVRLMMGVGNGRFEPERDITYQESVTILLRMLGYMDEANRTWPYGAIQTASELGLDQGLGITNNAGAISRGQAARLFYRMLSVCPKGSETPYAGNLGTLVDDAIILASNATINGTSGWVVTTKGGPYRSAGMADNSLIGQRGALLLNKAGQFVTLIADNSQCATVTVSRVQSGSLYATTGVRYTMTADTPVYVGTSGQVSTYAEMLPGILPGDVVTIYLDNGQVIGMFCGGSSGTDSRFLVAGNRLSAADLASLTGSDYNYTVRKNGCTISLSDIGQYDVLTYDAISKVVNVCDTRLACVYENAYPSEYAPVSITAAGGNTFSVMADAVEDLSNYSIGDRFILLFTADGRVAGAISGTNGNAIGVVSGSSVTLVGSRVTLNVSRSGSEDAAQGELVSVSSRARGQLSLSSLSLSRANGSFDADDMALGKLPVSDSVLVYEKGPYGLSAVALSALPSTIPASRIRGYHTNSSGWVDVIVLNQFTGDGYIYGRIDVSPDPYEMPRLDENDELVLDEETGKPVMDKWYQIIFSTPGGRTQTYVVSESLWDWEDDEDFYDWYGGDFGSVTLEYDYDLEMEIVVKIDSLRVVKNARSADFYTVDGVTYIQVGKKTYEVADDVLCYNAAASTWDRWSGTWRHVWFNDLLEARTFSSTLTLYVDSIGQKVRVVSAK